MLVTLAAIAVIAYLQGLPDPNAAQLGYSRHIVISLHGTALVDERYGGGRPHYRIRGDVCGPPPRLRQLPPLAPLGGGTPIYVHEAGHVKISLDDWTAAMDYVHQLSSCAAAIAYFPTAFQKMAADQDAYHARLRAECLPEIGCIPRGWLGW